MASDVTPSEASGSRSIPTSSQTLSHPLHAIFRAARDLMFLKDLDGRYVEVNPAMARFCGRSAEELLGAASDVPWGRETAKRLAQLEKRARQGEIFEVELELTTQGRQHVVHLVEAPVLDAEGKVVGLCGVGRDVTDRRETAQALRDSDTRYRRIIETAHEGVMVIDADSVITYANERLADMLGRTPEGMLGLPLSELILPEDWPDHLVQMELRRHGARVQFERRYRHTDGRTKWMSVSATPMMADDGRFLGAFAMFSDMTDRRRAEETLRNNREYLQAVVDAVNEAIVIQDLSTGKFIDVNSRMCELYGYTREEALGLSVQQLSAGVPPYTQREALEWLRRAKTDGPQVFKWRARHRSGDCFWAEVGIRIARLGEEERAILTVRDITERQRAEAERLEMERRLLNSQKLESLGVLAGGIAHDFNNLFTAVLGNLELALLDTPDTSAIFNNLREAMAATRRAADLTRQMLSYSGRGHYHPAELPLNDLIRRMEQLLKISVPKSASLAVELEDPIPPIRADGAQIQQVVMNLVTNAAEAIGERPGTIRIRTGCRDCDAAYLVQGRQEDDCLGGRYVFLEVSDTGCGMTEAVQERLFDPFFTTKFVGRGLGMSAVLGAVRAHKGAILVESEAGRGTTIRVLFPALGSTPAPPEATTTDPGHTRLSADAQTQRTVLVADDELPVRRLVENVLRRHGFQVIAAVDGEDAVELFRRHAPSINCALLDLSMPKLDGMATCKQLLAMRPDLKVLLATGHDEGEVSQRYSGQGLAGFLQKPFDLEVLVRELRRLSMERNP